MAARDIHRDGCLMRFPFLDLACNALEFFDCVRIEPLKVEFIIAQLSNRFLCNPLAKTFFEVGTFFLNDAENLFRRTQKFFEIFDALFDFKLS